MYTFWKVSESAVMFFDYLMIMIRDDADLTCISSRLMLIMYYLFHSFCAFSQLIQSLMMMRTLNCLSMFSHSSVTPLCTPTTQPTASLCCGHPDPSTCAQGVPVVPSMCRLSNHGTLWLETAALMFFFCFFGNPLWFLLLTRLLKQGEMTVKARCSVNLFKLMLFS